MDGYHLTYDYPGNVQLAYTQIFFHPREMPGGGQYFYVYGTKGAVDVNNSYFYPHDSESGGKPRRLVEEIEEDEQAHVKAFFESIRTGAPTPAGIDIAATAALTAILGREAIYQKKVMEWDGMGVSL
jgi:predicted dehydrogenase